MGSDRVLHDRRAALCKGSAWLVSFTLSLLAWNNAARAAKADKVVLHYQDQPRNGKSCADCWAFVRGAGAGAGTCKAVEGAISANGWCMAYSPKQKTIRPPTKPIAA